MKNAIQNRLKNCDNRKQGHILGMTNRSFLTKLSAPSILLMFLVISMGSCKKNEDVDSLSNSRAGTKYAKVEANFYQVTTNDDGNCGGWYIQAINPNFDFLIKIEEDLVDSIKNMSDLDQTKFWVDFTFTGHNYHCEKAYRKKVPQQNKYPYEIQMVSVTRIEKRN